MNLPNTLTVIRIALIPVLVAMFYLPMQWANYAAAGIFGLAAFTDWLDGFLARILKQTSRFGEFLDPVADKLVVSISLVMVVGSFGTPWVAIPGAIIIGREIAVSALREWMAEIGKRSEVKVRWLGKCKTVFQMLAIFTLLSQPVNFSLPLVWVGLTLLYIAAFLTLWSGLAYLQAAWGEIRGSAPNLDSL